MRAWLTMSSRSASSASVGGTSSAARTTFTTLGLYGSGEATARSGSSSGRTAGMRIGDTLGDAMPGRPADDALRRRSRKASASRRVAAMITDGSIGWSDGLAGRRSVPPPQVASMLRVAMFVAFSLQASRAACKPRGNVGGAVGAPADGRRRGEGSAAAQVSLVYEARGGQAHAGIVEALRPVSAHARFTDEGASGCMENAPSGHLATFAESVEAK